MSTNLLRVPRSLLVVVSQQQFEHEITPSAGTEGNFEDYTSANRDDYLDHDRVDLNPAEKKHLAAECVGHRWPGQANFSEFCNVKRFIEYTFLDTDR